MKTYVWTFPSRLFHLLLVLAFIVAYLTPDYIQIHATAGIFLGLLLLLRVIWGFIGPRYSRFKDFPMSISKIRDFISNIKIAEQKYTGHNPLAALILFLIIFDGIAVAITGMITLLSDDSNLFGSQILQNYHQHKEIHELFVNILLILIGIHILGLLVNWRLSKKTDVAKSMVSGFKQIQGIDAKLNGWQKGFGIFAALALVAILLITIILQWSSL